MINTLLSPYLPGYATTLVYMLQSTEYRIKPYLAWYWRTQDLSKVAYRRQLEHTRAANLLMLGLTLGMVLQIVAGLMCIGLWDRNALPGG